MGLAAPFARRHWSSPFGEWPQWRKDLGLGPHRGMDFNGLKVGTAIPSSGPGTVVGCGFSKVLGFWVVVHYPSARVFFGYCHLQQQGPAVGTVFSRAGVTVARVGNTGTATTGPHLHLTASRVNGFPGTVGVINPAAFFTSTAVASSIATTTIATTTIGGFLMGLSDRQQETVASQVNSLFDAVFRGGDSMPDGRRSIGQSLADIAAGRRPVVLRDTNADGRLDQLSALQDQADTNTMVRELAARTAALQAAVAAVAAGTGADAEHVAAQIDAAVEAALARHVSIVSTELEKALQGDFDDLRARLAALPEEVRKELKAAL